MNRPVLFRRALALAGLCFMTSQLWPNRERILTGRNDFLGIYPGAVLAGTDQLYDPQAVKQVQESRAQMWGESVSYFIRPPFYAALISPLRFLSYRAAYGVWELASIAALVAFLALWSERGREWMPAACAWFLPLYMALANGQDLPLLLLCVALAVRWAESRPRLAGALLSLCAIKFHLFLLIPVVLLVQRRRAMLAGGTLGMVGLLLLSFAAAGPGWLPRYLATLITPKIHPAPQIMISWYGFFERLDTGLWATALVSLAVMAVIALLSRRMALPEAISMALIGGALVAGHAYVQDASLMLPGLVTAAARFQNWVGLAAILLLTPLPYHWLLSGSPLGASIQIGSLGLLAGVLYCSRSPKTISAWASV